MSIIYYFWVIYVLNKYSFFFFYKIMLCIVSLLISLKGHLFSFYYIKRNENLVYRLAGVECQHKGQINACFLKPSVSLSIRLMNIL